MVERAWSDQRYSCNPVNGTPLGEQHSYGVANLRGRVRRWHLPVLKMAVGIKGDIVFGRSQAS